MSLNQEFFLERLEVHNCYVSFLQLMRDKPIDMDAKIYQDDPIAKHKLNLLVLNTIFQIYPK